jgi:hypothetical protein
MADNTTLPELASLSAKLGQLVRSNELKMAGKLLATSRGHLHQLAEKVPAYHLRYEHVAELRNDLMEPESEDLDPHRLLVRLMEEEKELAKCVSENPSEHALLALTLLRSAAAVVCVYCQDRYSDAPLDF